MQGSDNLCQRCGLPIGGSGSGTLTSGLARPQECQCAVQQAGSVQSSPKAAETVVRYQSRQVKRCQKCNNEYSMDFAEDVCSFDGCALVIADADKIVGSTIGARYKVQTVLGVGSWGAVYLAEDQQLKRQVAVKIMHEFLSHDELHCKRFQREGQTASNLTHPNIATVYDSGSLADGRPFIVMEYLNGLGLDQVLQREGELSIKRTIKIVSQLCDGLHYAHSKGVVHRDLKPGNIVLLENDVPKLLDFGLAKWGEAGDSITASGQVVGTAEYMSPEQFQGKQLDGRSDIYSLGTVIHYMLTGQKLFQGETLFDFFHQHVSDPPKSISAARPDLYFPAALRNEVLRCLSKDPAERLADCQTLKDALSEAGTGRSSEMVKLSAASTTGPQQKVKAGRTAIFAIGASLLTIGGITAIIANSSLRDGFSNASSKVSQQDSSIRLTTNNINQSNVLRTSNASSPSGGLQAEQIANVSADHVGEKEISSAPAATKSAPQTTAKSAIKRESDNSREGEVTPAETTARTKSTAVKSALAAAALTVTSTKSQPAERRKNAELIPPTKQAGTSTKLPYKSDEVNTELSLPPPDKVSEASTPAKGETTPATNSASTGTFNNNSDGTANSETSSDESDLMRGRRYMQTKNLVEAEKCFKRVLATNDRSSISYLPALHGLVTLCMQENRTQEAMDYAIEYSKDAKPGSLGAAMNHKLIGDCACTLRNYVLAEKELSLARDSFRNLNGMPAWCNLTRRLALVKRAEGDYAAAAALYKEEADYRQKVGEPTGRALADLATCQSELKKHQAVTSETPTVDSKTQDVQQR